MGTFRSRPARTATGSVLVLALSLLLAACDSSAPAAPPPNQGLVLNRSTPRSVPMVNQMGVPVTLSSLRGSVVVLAPFLSLCQDECPLVTGAFISLQHDLQAAGLGSKVVFVEATVDPGRDSVARLAAYQSEFGAHWELWTGTAANVAAFWRPFGVNYQIVPEEQPPKLDWWTGKPLTYDVVHTDGYFLVDPHGRERYVDATAPDVKDLSPKLRALLNAGGLDGLLHPQQPTWTVDDALAALSWVLGTNVPPASP